ncbi:ferrochelatase [Luteimonas aquatica]|uniref:ferrochelatase n=1 Tax=Luteimonas aquatica TaxID=450364 RepID=UPI001F58FC23|nr:ferrochelatase [Luteimonas aquatica]
MPAAPARDRAALLLVNLGTPEAPTAPAVRRYLGEFLGDRRVVQLSRWLWLPLLHGVILPLRSRRVARKYAEIWLPGGSPLAVHTRRLAEALQARLPLPVAHAMRYGAPAIADALHALARQGRDRILVLPLYPQYSTTTTASVADALTAFSRAHGALAPQLRMIDQYATDAGVVGALAASIRAHWQAHGRGERLLLSFHGIPQRLVDAGDPYAQQCRATAQALARALDLAPEAWTMTFQSRFGRERWLLPATDATLQALAAEGVRRVDVACPGFPVDCLETLEEIAIQNAACFRDAGGERLSYIPCLNDAPAHADALAALVRGHLETWT